MVLYTHHFELDSGSILDEHLFHENTKHKTPDQKITD